MKLRDAACGGGIEGLIGSVQKLTEADHEPG